MQRDYFCKNCGNIKNGFTYEEALLKKQAVDEAYGVNLPESMWNPSVIEHEQGGDGYKVFIERKLLTTPEITVNLNLKLIS